MSNDEQKVTHRKHVSFLIIVSSCSILLTVPVFSLLQTRHSIEPTLAAPTRATPVPTAQVIKNKRTPGSTDRLSTPQKVIAIVNDRELDGDMFTMTLAIDRALTTLLGQTFSAENALDRMVNTELVVQAATEKNFNVSDQVVEQFLQQFLTEKEILHQELVSALIAEGITLPEFTDYFSSHLVRYYRPGSRFVSSKRLSYDLFLRCDRPNCCTACRAINYRTIGSLYTATLIEID